jgi:hypothetical protein
MDVLVIGSHVLEKSAVGSRQSAVGSPQEGHARLLL